MSSTYFKPDRFLELAQKLIDDKKYDERTRSRVVVGRAYYTVFLKAQKKLGELGYSYPDEHRLHQQTIDYLRDLKPDLSDKFSALFDKRVEADYFVNADIRKETGKNSIKMAQIIEKELVSLAK